MTSFSPKLFDTNRWHYRGPRPTTPYHYNQLAELGIETILDLETYPFDLDGARRCAAVADAAALGMVTMHLPLGVVSPPGLFRLIAAVRLLNDKEMGKRIYLHCRQGVDRTGMVAAAWHMAMHGWPPEMATTDMLDNGFHRNRYWWWIPTLKRFHEEFEKGNLKL